MHHDECHFLTEELETYSKNLLMSQMSIHSIIFIYFKVNGTRSSKNGQITLHWLAFLSKCGTSSFCWSAYYYLLRWDFMLELSWPLFNCSTLLKEFFRIALPLVMGHMLEYFKGNMRFDQVIMLAISISLMIFISGIFHHLYYHYTLMFSMRIKSACIGLLYKKVQNELKSSLF